MAHDGSFAPGYEPSYRPKAKNPFIKNIKQLLQTKESFIAVKDDENSMLRICGDYDEGLIAVSPIGNTYGEQVNPRGRVYVFEKTALGWCLVQEIQGDNLGGRFGASIDMVKFRENFWLAIGAPSDGEDGLGRVYLRYYTPGTDGFKAVEAFAQPNEDPVKHNFGKSVEFYINADDDKQDLMLHVASYVGSREALVRRLNFLIDTASTKPEPRDDSRGDDSIEKANKTLVGLTVQQMKEIFDKHYGVNPHNVPCLTTHRESFVLIVSDIENAIRTNNQS